MNNFREGDFQNDVSVKRTRRRLEHESKAGFPDKEPSKKSKLLRSGKSKLASTGDKDASESKKRLRPRSMTTSTSDNDGRHVSSERATKRFRPDETNIQNGQAHGHIPVQTNGKYTDHATSNGSTIDTQDFPSKNTINQLAVEKLSELKRLNQPEQCQLVSHVDLTKDSISLNKNFINKYVKEHFQHSDEETATKSSLSDSLVGHLCIFIC